MSLRPNQKHTIILTVISIIGTIAVAMISNWDKVGCNEQKRFSKEEKVKIEINDVQKNVSERTNNAIISHRYDEFNDDFTEQLKLLLPTAKMKSLSDTILNSLGNFQSKDIKFIAKAKEFDDRDVVYITNRFTNRDLLVTIIFDDENKICGFYLNPFDFKK